MIFAHYFFKRYFKYVITIALLLASLLLLIELFEKLMRVSHASFMKIGFFLSLLSGPLFFDNCGIAAWLGSSFLLREFFMHHEWEFMMMLNMTNKNLIHLFALASCILMSSVFISKELFISTLAFKAEHFKIQHFKQRVPQLILNRWIQLHDNEFCYVGALDMASGQGKDLTLLKMSPNFLIEEALLAKTFSINAEKSEVDVGHGSYMKNGTQENLNLHQKKIVVPQLFSQVALEFEVPTIRHYYTVVKQASKLLPSSVFNKLLYQFLKKITWYLQIFLYPVMTVFFFVICSSYARLRWIALFIAYPLFLMLDALLDLFFSYGCSPWIALVPYGLLVSVLIIIERYYLPS